MKGIGQMVVALFRPKRAFDRLAQGARWLWLLPFALLVASAMAKAAVVTPLVMQEQEAFITDQMGQPVVEGESRPESGPKEAPPQETAVEVSEDQMAAVSTIATTSAVVFGGIGAAAAILFTATFFFVAAKVSAKTVRYGAFLTLASVAFLPHAFRNVVQVVYMSATGIALQHSGLGALVAPADPTVAPPFSYALLSQIDIWVVWGLVVLAGGLLSELVGLERKRAFTALGAFVAVTVIMQAIPTLVTGAFMGMGG